MNFASAAAGTAPQRVESAVAVDRAAHKHWPTAHTESAMGNWPTDRIGLPALLQPAELGDAAAALTELIALD